MQIYADVLNARINLAASDQAVALGAAILGCLAAGPHLTGYHAVSQAISAMAHVRDDLLYRPDLHARRRYDSLYASYLTLTAPQGPLVQTMHTLRSF
jgi:L-ribulokinase